MNGLRLALRRARRRRWATAAGSLTLALGIGASTAAFSAVQGVLLEPLPVTAQEDLVVLWRESLERDFAHVPFTERAFSAVRSGVPALVSAAAIETVGARLAVAEGVDGSYSLNHVRVAGDFFGVLGVLRAARADPATALRAD